jgi:hypothetical protein
VGTAAKGVGRLAVAASVLYLITDVIEASQGGFSVLQLWLTLIAEAAVPIFVVGLAFVQRPRLGRLGAYAALAYAYAFVVFAGTVVYALVNDTKDYDALTDKLGLVMTVHGAVMVTAGLGLGYAVIRSRVFPALTAIALMAGVVLVALAQGGPEGVQLIAAGTRDLAFAGMGLALLRTPTSSPGRTTDTTVESQLFDFRRVAPDSAISIPQPRQNAEPVTKRASTKPGHDCPPTPAGLRR